MSRYQNTDDRDFVMSSTSDSWSIDVQLPSVFGIVYLATYRFLEIMRQRE